MSILKFRIFYSYRFAWLRSLAKASRMALFAAMVALSAYLGYQWADQMDALAMARIERDVAVAELHNQPTFRQKLEELSVRDILIAKTKWKE